MAAGIDGGTGLDADEVTPFAGTDLGSLLVDRARLAQGEAVRVAHAVATELAAAHEAGLVHGGLGPGLVLVDPVTGAVEVGGLRGSAEGAAAGVRQSGACLAPEQLAGGEADTRSDLYALGCLLMQMLTGTVPAPPSPAGPPDGSEALTAAAPWPSDHLPDVDPALDGLVHDLLAASANLRPESAREVVGRLERIADEAGGHSAAVAIPAEAGGLSVAVVIPANEGDLPDLPDLARPADLAELPEEAPGLAMFGFVGTDEWAAHDLEDEGEGQEGARTEPILVAGARDGDRRATGSSVGAIPRPWLAGSVAGVALVLAVLVISLLGGGSQVPVAAPPFMSSPTEPSTPSASQQTDPPGTTTATTTSASASATATTTTTTTTRPTSRPATSPTQRRVATAPAPPRQQLTLAGAIDALRATARAVVSSGDVDGRAAQELVRRADDLASWLDRNRNQLARRVSDLDGYVADLLRTRQITSDGYRRVSSALDQVRARL